MHILTRTCLLVAFSLGSSSSVCIGYSIRHGWREWEQFLDMVWVNYIRAKELYKNTGTFIMDEGVNNMREYMCNLTGHEYSALSREEVATYNYNQRSQP